MDIDPLYSAAALARVEHCAINQRIHRRIQIRIFHDIARIFAAQLQPHAGERPGGCALHGFAAPNGACEIDVVESSVRDQRGSRVVIQKYILENVFWYARILESLRHPLADQQRLGGMLQNHCVACDQGRGYRVDCCHIGVVPGSNDKYDAVRYPFDVTFERLVFANCDVGKAFFRNLCHVSGAFVEPTKFTTIANGTTHHFCKFWDDVIIHRSDCRYPGKHQIYTILKWACGPFGLSRFCAFDSLFGGLFGKGFTGCKD